jgi:hypothetical protein
MATKQLVNANSQFFTDMTSADRVINVNGGDMPIGYYNLLLTIRDLGLYKVGLKPNRHWKITDVKKYFGIKGSAESMLEELNTIKDFLKAK